jgi:hypothetical protein
MRCTGRRASRAPFNRGACRWARSCRRVLGLVAGSEESVAGGGRAGRDLTLVDRLAVGLERGVAERAGVQPEAGQVPGDRSGAGILEVAPDRLAPAAYEHVADVRVAVQRLHWAELFQLRGEPRPGDSQVLRVARRHSPVLHQGLHDPRDLVQHWSDQRQFAWVIGQSGVYLAQPCVLEHDRVVRPHAVGARHRDCRLDCALDAVQALLDWRSSAPVVCSKMRRQAAVFSGCSSAWRRILVTRRAEISISCFSQI